MTPLYKRLKSNGTSFYAFPGAAEDISAAYQNSNYKMYFSKYVLLNLPKQQLNPGSGTQSNQVYWDFSKFKVSNNSTAVSNFQDGVVESLRNYVANQEVVVRESRLNNTNYYYDTNSLETTTEKIFFKWCKSLNLIDFEQAIPNDEYFPNLEEFQRRNLDIDDFLPEYLWKEREVKSYNTIEFSESDLVLNKLQIKFNGTTNFRVGDIVRIYNVENNIINTSPNLLGIDTEMGIRVKVLQIIPATSTQGQIVIFDINSNLSANTELKGKAEIVYHRLVQYIGEVNGISNVQEANRSYTEVYAHIPDHTGQTPDILFRTLHDVNYKPNMTFPIIPNQYQPEIMGAELFNSPIVNTPQNYPGSYFGQFDTDDFTYETQTGDIIRRSGEYFGVSGDVNEPSFNGSTIDGISVDFNNRHYIKMNLVNREVSNFDQFNALEVDNKPPKSFEFNAILWYYTVRNDATNEIRTNLYGISFLDNPDNEQIDTGLKFPTYKKLVANGEQDGTSYAFSLNLNFNIINENPQDSYNPEAINSMFSMNLFNEAMSRLSRVNESFLDIIGEQEEIRTEVRNIKQLIYTQTELSSLNQRMRNLEELLRLYSTNQMVSSNTVKVNISTTSPPVISLENIDTSYVNIENIRTTQLYNPIGIAPISVNVPENKNFLVNIINDDEVDLLLPNDENLSIIINRDLDFKQTLDIFITGGEFSSQNKKLDIFIMSRLNSNDTIPVESDQLPLSVNSDSGFVTDVITESLIIGNIDLPVFYNNITQLPNSASKWKDFKFTIDFNRNIQISNGFVLQIPLNENSKIVENSIKVGDALYINNLFLGTSSVFNFSGQYVVQSVSSDSIIGIDISNNNEFKTFVSGIITPLHSTNSSLFSNLPYFSLNKGKKISLTRISEDNVPLRERYRIDITDIQ
jgi:hypothetical protein